MENVSNVGWVVVAFVAVLIFIVLMRRPVKLGTGDKQLSIGQHEAVDKKLNALKAEIEAKEIHRLQDEELRKKLFRQSAEIDEMERADERRVIRRLNSVIRDIFTPYIHCEMPMLSVVELIKDVLQERVDYNCMRKRLTETERKGYIQDILFYIETDYKTFLTKIPAVPCGAEQYPLWQTVEPKISALVNEWADEMIRIIASRINEKITMYTAEQASFMLPEYKDLCINFPVKKNRGYLRALGVPSEGYYGSN